MSTLMIYGATGYTGELIAREALRQGLRPLLAGRGAAKLAALGRELGLEWRAFALDDPGAARAALVDVRALLNASGPFRRTAPPLVELCLRAGIDYLDISAEVAEFEALVARDADARAAGALLLPGVGFGIVPTDCLAAHLKRRLPGARALTLAFLTEGGVSQGTAETVIADLPRGGVVRRDGRLVHVPAGWRSRAIDFGRGPVATLTNPWRADVIAAYESTGIPNIEVFAVVPAPLRRLMRASRYLGPLLGTRLVQGLLLRQARGLAAGLDATARAAGRTVVWGEVADDAGRRASARLEGPEAYDFSALTALAVARRVLAGERRAGFQTPARLFGPDFVLECPGVARVDLDGER